MDDKLTAFAVVFCVVVAVLVPWPFWLIPLAFGTCVFIAGVSHVA